MARYEDAKELHERLLNAFLDADKNAIIDIPDRLLPHNKVITLPKYGDILHLELNSTGAWACGRTGYNNVIVSLEFNIKDPIVAALAEMLSGLSLYEKNKWPFTAYEVCILHMNPHVSKEEKYFITLSYPDAERSRGVEVENHTVDRLSHKKLAAKIMGAMKFYHKLYFFLKKRAEKTVSSLPGNGKRVPERYLP